MRQKVVWFVLGILIGSLFIVGAYPQYGNVPDVAPSFETYQGKNYTAYLFYSNAGGSINKDLLVKKIEALFGIVALKAKWHAYAIPDLPKDINLVGYGIKITKDGRTESYIFATRKNILAKDPKTDLIVWAKKEPIFTGKISTGTYGPPEGWEVKISSNTGEEGVLSGQVSPYWYDIGPATLRLTYPPYGNIDMKFHLYVLTNDGDPSRVYFLLAPGKDSDGWYRIEPGYWIKHTLENNNYGDYVTDTARIIHDWNLDHTLDPKIETAYPLETLGGHQEIPVTLGYPPSLTFNVIIPDSEMLPAVDSSTQRAGWLLDFNPNSKDAMYSFCTNVYSKANVRQSSLLDGNWHKIVKVEFQASFMSQNNFWGIWGTQTATMALTWNLKVG